MCAAGRLASHLRNDVLSQHFFQEVQGSEDRRLSFKIAPIEGKVTGKS